MRTFCLVLVLPPFLVSLPGCHKDPPAPMPAHIHATGTPRTDEVLSAFRKGGLQPEGFATSKPIPAPALYCEQGKVSFVDTTICEYTDAQALARAVQQIKEGWARVDAHTGVVVHAKRTVLALVDRERREPSGKTINKMIDIFGRL